MNKQQLIEKLTGNIFDTAPDHEGYLTIAELKEEKQNGLTISTETNTVIIPHSLIARIKPAIMHPNVSSPSAYFHPEYIYKSAFWIFLAKSSGLKKTEPLVVTWDSGNYTTLVPDQVC